jgi:hypothetical protein
MKRSIPLLAEDGLAALVQAARGADQPNELSRARVRRRVEIQLAAGDGVALARSGVGVAGVVKAAVVAAVVGAVAGAGVASVYVRQHRDRQLGAVPARAATADPVRDSGPSSLAIASSVASSPAARIPDNARSSADPMRHR